MGLRELLMDQKAYARMANAVNPYGDGHAAPRIPELRSFVMEGFGVSSRPGIRRALGPCPPRSSPPVTKSASRRSTAIRSREFRI